MTKKTKQIRKPTKKEQKKDKTPAIESEDGRYWRELVGNNM